MNRCPWYRQLVVKLSLLAVFVCLLSGCGTIDVSLKTIFNADGSGERIMHMVADGIFAVMLDDRSIDEEASKKGWTVERYNKDSQRHMVLKCKFKAADQIGASTPSLIHPSEEVQAKFGDYNPNVEFHVRPGFPYRIFAYRETIEPSPDMREDVCYDCDGKGYETCLACNGKGRNTCLECGGSGLVSFMGEQSTCPTCGGTGYIPCLLCSGQGRTVCSACGGTGKPGEMQRSIEQTVSEMIHIRNEVMLPGKVISTNADRRDGDALTWDITFERLVTGMTMQATSRQLNTPAVAVLSIGLLVIAVLLTIAIRMNAQR